MIISLFLLEKIVKFKLPNEISGSYSFYSDDSESKLINIEARNGQWYLYKTAETEIINNYQERNVAIKPGNFYGLRKENKNYLIYVDELKLNNIYSFTYDNQINLNIGNTNSSNIMYNCSYLNGNNIKINYQNNSLCLQKNGNIIVYINKNALSDNTYNIKNGDEIEIYGLKILFLEKIFLINNIEGRITINKTNAKIDVTNFPNEQEIENRTIKDIDLYQESDYYSKSPRMRRIIETKNIKLSSPPTEGENQELPLILVIGPMLTMGVMSFSTILNTIIRISNKNTTIGESWPQLLTGFAMLISMIVWPTITQKYNKKMKKLKKEEIIKKYTAYLNEKRKELSSEANLQRIILTENLLTVDECLNILKHKNINFWDKRIDQNDFLVTRLGVGTEKLDIKIEYNEEDFSIDEDDLKKEADKLNDEFKYIKNVPIGYSFYENKITAIMGKYNKVKSFVNNIILQLITFYSYEDLKIVVFTDENKCDNWEYVKYLNHNFTNDRYFRFFSSNYESAKNIAEYLTYEMNNRLSEKSTYFKPYYLIIIDGYQNVKKFDFMKTLTELDDNIGFSFIILENKLSKLPSKCDNFITIGESTSTILKKAYEKQEKTEFMDEIHYNINMMNIAKELSNIPIEFDEGMKELPNSITFLEMEKVGKVEQLNVLNRWNINDSTTSLKAEIGIDEQQDLMYLDLHEKYHGPHGLIAGMTGSGKSEFIITYILSMAINYSPDDVAFILIDYKGGGLAFAFENKTKGIVLPHLAGTITNLDKAEMDRTLVSIDSEIKRRQQEFNIARDKLGESTIDIYKYQKFYKDGKLDKPIPHLFIICDEFAELKSQQPDFMDNLISVARIGRSLGVHLILATQKPSGVVNEQIWSNTKFRVCLKVQDEQDSKEMLKRPEAASLKQAGRYYLQVGYDELFALGQSGWCGAKYYPSDKIVKQVDKSINFIDENGNFIKSVEASNNINLKPQGEQLTAILNEIIAVSNYTGKRVKKLWLENIPKIILEEDIYNKYNITTQPYNVEAIIGEYDAPESQLQGIVKYNFIENGNTIIYGNDGAEREMLLDTIIYSAVKRHSSDEVNFYIIDYGSESFRKYNSLPHIGGLVFQSDDEKYNNLMKFIKEEINKRKKMFVNYGSDYKYYINNNTQKLPIEVIIINNYDSLYSDKPNIYDELPDLIRDSERYGIIFILTANGISSIHSKISSNCSNIYTLKLKDSSDYSSALGARTKLVPRDITGRGLLNVNGIHEFQTASIVPEDEDLNKFLMNFIENEKRISQKNANKIPELPQNVRYNNINIGNMALNNIPVGISKNDLEIISVDFFTSLGYIISSNKITNIEKFIKSLIIVLLNISGINLTIIDPMKSLKLNKSADFNYFFDNFAEEIDKLNEAIKKQIDSNNKMPNIILIYGLNKFMTKLNNSEKMDELIKLVKEHEKISIIVIDAATKIKPYVFETWFTSIFSINDGIWIGRGIADQSLLHLSTITRDMTKEYKTNMGYVISENSGVLCKMIDFITDNEEI